MLRCRFDLAADTGEARRHVSLLLFVRVDPLADCVELGFQFDVFDIGLAGAGATLLRLRRDCLFDFRDLLPDLDQLRMVRCITCFEIRFAEFQFVQFRFQRALLVYTRVVENALRFEILDLFLDRRSSGLFFGDLAGSIAHLSLQIVGRPEVVVDMLRKSVRVLAFVVVELLSLLLEPPGQRVYLLGNHRRGFFIFLLVLR